MGDTLRSQTISTKLQQIAKQAANYPDMVFTTLAHHIDVDFLYEAYRQNNRKSSPGIDKVTSKEYDENLELNLQNLHERLRKGLYKAPPVERVWIDKEGNKKRPIGKPTLEDKIVQRAVEMVLSAVYEQMFHDFSYGFRKGRSQHQAIKELMDQCWETRGGWIISADITGLFDNINHGYLREIIKRRVNDGGIIRLIGKWLKAGVYENGSVSYPESGTPQGGSISPILSNIFLHHVLDDWFVNEVKPRMKGLTSMVRWADDFIIICEHEYDAIRLMEVMPKRFSRYGLSLHPEKSKVVSFKRPKPYVEKDDRNGTFDFLGFTFYWGKSLKGYWIIRKKTARKRQSRFLKSCSSWCKANRHLSMSEQHKALCQKLSGFYQYFGVQTNNRSLGTVFFKVEQSWRYWLGRRSHKGYVSYEKFDIIRKVYPLPQPRIVHNI